MRTFLLRPVSTPTVRTTAILLLFLLMYPARAQQTAGEQEIPLSWEEFVEDFFEKETEDETEDFRKRDLLERLEELHAAPLNLNTASREELLGLPFLDEAQADSLLAYRKRKRLLRSTGELMFVQNIRTETRRVLPLFVFAGDTLRTRKSAVGYMEGGRHEVTSRLDIPLYRRAGYRSISHEEQETHPNRTYLGSRLANTTRYRYRKRKDLAFGLTLQKDAGEPFGKEGNYPYDYTSFYAYFRPRSGRLALWIGDFDVRTGQGLLMGSSYFDSRTQWVETPPHNRPTVKAHTSTEESGFMRGTAAQFTAGRWKFTGYASYRKLDARLENGKVTSFQTDGLHRTRTELDRRRLVGNATGGGHLSYTGNSWSVGAGGYYARYDKDIQPPVRTYNRYYLRGQTAAGGSADWSWRTERWHVTGEAALDRGGNEAISTTLRFAPAGNMAFALQHRHFSPRFVAPYAATLQETSRVQNEQAVLLGGRFTFLHGLEMLTYIDCFRHPRPTFRAGAPSQGLETGLSLKHTPGRGNRSFTLRYRIKYKQQDITGRAGTLEYKGTHKLQGGADFRTKHFRTHLAADLCVATRQTTRNSVGWMVSARGLYTLPGRISAGLFTAVFFTDDYDTRLYAYEPQLKYAGGFPTFAYHGARAVAMAEWKALKNCSVGFRYAGTYYFNRQSIGSGTQRIDSSSQNDISVQLSITL